MIRVWSILKQTPSSLNILGSNYHTKLPLQEMSKESMTHEQFKQQTEKSSYREFIGNSYPIPRREYANNKIKSTSDDTMSSIEDSHTKIITTNKNNNRFKKIKEKIDNITK